MTLQLCEVDPRAFERVGPGNTNDDVPGFDLPGDLLRSPLAQVAIPVQARMS